MLKEFEGLELTTPERMALVKMNRHEDREYNTVLEDGPSLSSL